MWAAGELSYTWSLLKQRVYRQTESTAWESIHFIIQAQLVSMSQVTKKIISYEIIIVQLGRYTTRTKQC